MGPTDHKPIAMQPNQPLGAPTSKSPNEKRRIDLRGYSQKKRDSQDREIKALTEFYISKTGSHPPPHAVLTTQEDALLLLKSERFNQHPIYIACLDNLSALAQYILSTPTIFRKQEPTQEFRQLLASGVTLTEADFPAARAFRRRVINIITSQNSRLKKKHDISFLRKWRDEVQAKESAQIPGTSGGSAVLEGQQTSFQHAEDKTKLPTQTSRKRKQPSTDTHIQNESTKKSRIN